MGNLIQNIRIEQDKDHSHIQRIYADGEELHKIRSVDTHIEACEIPTVTVEFIAGTSFDGLANLEAVLHPETITECVKGIQFALQMDSDFRDAVKASILSAVKEGCWESTEELADAIYERIFFGER